MKECSFVIILVFRTKANSTKSFLCSTSNGFLGGGGDNRTCAAKYDFNWAQGNLNDTCESYKKYCVLKCSSIFMLLIVLNIIEIY